MRSASEKGKQGSSARNAARTAASTICARIALVGSLQSVYIFGGANGAHDAFFRSRIVDPYAARAMNPRFRELAMVRHESRRHGKRVPHMMNPEAHQFLS